MAKKYENDFKVLIVKSGRSVKENSDEFQMDKKVLEVTNN